MQSNRRRFLKFVAASSAVTFGSTAWWLTTSRRRGARYLREIIADAKRSVLPSPVHPNPAKWPDQQITVCWLGHATTLINFYGVRILTDPVFFSRVGISLGLGTAGPKRYIAPALLPHELPPIDLVLLSHAHMDHMDLASLRRLPRTVPVVTARLTKDILIGTGLQKITELGWAERMILSCPEGKLQVQAVEVKHWGRRWPSELERGYNGYILRREGKSLLFAGDTARTRLLGQLRSHGPFEAAIMPIGAYQPWIWNHCTPEQAVEMANQAGARYIVPVHHQTFRLSEEPMNEPIERLQAVLEKEQERLALTRVGQSFTC